MNIEEVMARMEAIVAASDAENRSLSDEEVTEYEGLESELAKLTRDHNVRSRHSAYKTPVINGVQTAAPKGDEVLERAFDSYLRTGRANQDLVELRAQGEGTPSAGGYLVPDGFRRKLVEKMEAFGGILSVVENITTATGNTISWPTLDDTANSAEIVAEHGTGVAGADVVFGTADLGAYKYMSLGAGNLPLRVSVELLQDSAFDIQSLLARILGKRIRKAMAVDAVTGDGTGEPLGIATGTPGANLTTTTTVTYADLLTIVHAVDPDYRDNARWAFNDATLSYIRGLVDGNQRPLLSDAGAGISAAPGGERLLGFPVTIDQAFADRSGDNTIFGVFGDLQAAYVWRTVRDVQLVVDPYTRAANGEVQFTAWARADGTIQDPNAYVTFATQDV